MHRCIVRRVGRRSPAAYRSAATRSCDLHPSRSTLNYYNWSGFYIGDNLGAAWNSGGSVSDTFGSTFSGSGQTTKFVGGGQIGVNYEFREGVVVGAEAMFDWLPNTTNTFNAIEGPSGPFPGTLASATFNNRWLTTATGTGHAWDTVLLYGKAGGAWARGKQS